jgi:hypothetical protein
LNSIVRMPSVLLVRMSIACLVSVEKSLVVWQ